MVKIFIDICIIIIKGEVIMEVVVAGQFKIIKKIGCGAFGEIF